MSKFDFSGLNGGVLKVVFEKVDGTLRTMLCTRKPDLIKGEVKNPQTLEEGLKSGCLRVFDVEKESWRSFRVDSVQSVEVA